MYAIPTIWNIEFEPGKGCTECMNFQLEVYTSDNVVSYGVALKKNDGYNYSTSSRSMRMRTAWFRYLKVSVSDYFRMEPHRIDEYCLGEGKPGKIWDDYVPANVRKMASAKFCRT